MKRKESQSRRSLAIGVKFFVILLIFILISLSFKAIAIVGKSLYHGETPFSISISNRKELKILTFSSSKPTIHIIKINGQVNLNIKKLLGVPIQGEIITDLDIKNGNTSSLMGKLTLNYSLLKTNLTILDMIRLFLVALTIPKENIDEKIISASMPNAEIDKITSSVFKDPIIEEENATIKIVNATNASGLGARAARFIANMGGNVVIVSSGERLENESSISYFGKKTHTVGRVEKALGFKMIDLEKKGITDIIIVIGKDRENSLNF